MTFLPGVTVIFVYKGIDQISGIRQKIWVDNANFDDNVGEVNKSGDGSVIVGTSFIAEKFLEL